VKSVVKKARDEKGMRLFNVEWDHEFIEMPLVNKNKQKTPSFTGDVVTGIVRVVTKPVYRMLLSFARLRDCG
jgi:hypothetical protein